MVTSTTAEAQLQPLMDGTVRHLSEYLEEVLITLKEKERDCLTIISKWDCDRSQQSQFKQKLEKDIDSNSSIFQSCFAPLQLVSEDKNKKVLWNNPTPSSPRFCGPIRFRFINETNDVTEEEITHVKSAITFLVPPDVDLGGKKLLIKHNFIITMVDGKVGNAATGTKFTSLVIDIPKSNFGNTNDGNTSKRFFENLTLAAEITGIRYKLIYILEEISSGFKVDPVNYERYASETARLYVKWYDWHPMMPTMHKILVHGAVIIERAMVPIGQLSKEAAEACSKYFRSHRQDFARKYSRHAKCKKRKAKTFLPKTLAMFVSAESHIETGSSSKSDEESQESQEI
ncbi:unnamed protein product [Psylliodes chrysocephalus]|uniref:Uncharacterized protein n=1 Tax=Psylliodes chrysocephalus TaxID=3402493 RepID=A0A9P0D250_9CUCU|nr:unnamed protein product [Psylliodes chrysocephala]